MVFLKDSSSSSPSHPTRPGLFSDAMAAVWEASACAQGSALVALSDHGLAESLAEPTLWLAVRRGLAADDRRALLMGAELPEGTEALLELLRELGKEVRLVESLEGEHGREGMGFR